MKLDVEKLTHIGVFLGIVSIGLVAVLSAVSPESADSPAIKNLLTGICVLLLAVLFAGELRDIF